MRLPYCDEKKRHIGHRGDLRYAVMQPWSLPTPDLSLAFQAQFLARAHPRDRRNGAVIPCGQRRAFLIGAGLRREPDRAVPVRARARGLTPAALCGYVQQADCRARFGDLGLLLESRAFGDRTILSSDRGLGWAEIGRTNGRSAFSRPQLSSIWRNSALLARKISPLQPLSTTCAKPGHSLFPFFLIPISTT